MNATSGGASRAAMKHATTTITWREGEYAWDAITGVFCDQLEATTEPVAIATLEDEVAALVALLEALGAPVQSLTWRALPYEAEGVATLRVTGWLS